MEAGFEETNPLTDQLPSHAEEIGLPVLRLGKGLGPQAVPEAVLEHKPRAGPGTAHGALAKDGDSADRIVAA